MITNFLVITIVVSGTFHKSTKSSIQTPNFEIKSPKRFFSCVGEFLTPRSSDFGFEVPEEWTNIIAGPLLFA